MKTLPSATRKRLVLLIELLQKWKKGQLLAATGVINAVSRQYFNIDEVEEIRLTTDKEDLTVAPGLATEDHTKQEEN